LTCPRGKIVIGARHLADVADGARPLALEHDRVHLPYNLISLTAFENVELPLL
jgi:hypothetical protein